MTRALDNVRVIDFGQYIAGPLLAELLAQQGADVVHVDPPGGPRLPGLPDALVNRGKRRITLDLTQAEDNRVAMDLVHSADVLVENFRPGVLTGLGLGPEAATAANPRLVYCSLPGFAADDPRAGTPAWEGIVLAATAGYRRLHEHWDWRARSQARVDDPGRPLFTALPMASTTAALLGALAVMLALLRRESTGRGARLEVPLAEAMMELVGFHLEMPDFVGRRASLPRPCLGSFESADHRFVDQVPYPRFVQRFLEAAGAWDEWRAAGLGDMAQVFTDPALTRQADDRFSRLIGSRPAGEWEAIAIDLGIPLAQVRMPAEWLACAEAHGSGSVTDVKDPEYGLVSMAGAAIDTSHAPAEIRPRSLPDADRQAILREALGLASPPSLPRDPRRRNDPGDPGDLPPLAGVAVVELSQVVAAPVAGRLLADYGADVIKVANPAPTGNNGFHGGYTNRGKRTVYLDVQDRADQKLLRSAIDRADVVLQNYAFGSVERYGIGFEQLRPGRPDLVYVSLGAFPRTGPWRHRRGHENQAVSATGLSARYGGPGGQPIYQPYLVCDIGLGILGALAAALGLYRRHRTGQGEHLSTSLAQAATLHQGVYLFTGPDHARLPEPTSPDAAGWSAIQRLYQAADGWLFVAATPDQRDALLRVTAPPGQSGARVKAGSPDGALAEALAVRFRTRTTAQWAETLVAAGIAAQRVRDIGEVAHDPAWHQRGVLRYGLNGEGQDTAPVLGTRPLPWTVPARALRHPGPLGADTEAVRAELSAVAATTDTSNKHRSIGNKGVPDDQH